MHACIHTYIWTCEQQYSFTKEWKHVKSYIFYYIKICSPLPHKSVQSWRKHLNVCVCPLRQSDVSSWLQRSREIGFTQQSKTQIARVDHLELHLGIESSVSIWTFSAELKMNVCAAWPRTWRSPRSLVCNGFGSGPGTDLEFGWAVRCHRW